MGSIGFYSEWSYPEGQIIPLKVGKEILGFKVIASEMRESGRFYIYGDVYSESTRNTAGPFIRQWKT